MKKAVLEGDIDNGSFMAGQIAGLVHDIKTVKQVLEDLFDEVNDYKNKLEVM